MGGALFGILFLELLLAHAADKFSVVDGSIVSISAGRQAGYLVRLLLSQGSFRAPPPLVGWRIGWPVVYLPALPRPAGLLAT